MPKKDQVQSKRLQDLNKSLLKKNRKIKLAEKKRCMVEQIDLYECFLCKHAFPPEFMKFMDDTFCQNHIECAKRFNQKYHYYAKAIEGDLDWWKKQVKASERVTLVTTFSTLDPANVIKNHYNYLKWKREEKKQKKREEQVLNQVEKDESSE